MEHEFYEGNEYLSSLPADADRAEDFEYEVRSMAHCNFSAITDMVFAQVIAGSSEGIKKSRGKPINTIKCSFLYLCNFTSFTVVSLHM